MSTTADQPTQPDAAPRRGLAARVSLGRRTKPTSIEFALIAGVAVLLTGIGFVMVLSATSASAGGPFDTAIKQGVFVVIGMPLMFVLSRFRIATWKRLAWPALIAALAFQALIFSPLAIDGDGNTAWIRIGPFQAQPAEFLKLATIIWIGAILARKQALLGQWKHFVIPVVPVLIVVLASVLGGEDLGTAMILMLVIFASLFFAGVKLRIFILPLLVVIGGVMFFAISNENRRDRITAFLDPNCTDAMCYQQQHGLWALANGGIFGTGLGNSVEKYGWLPAQGNDFIFAIIGEELGLVGCIVVLLLFGVLAFAGLSMVRRTDDTFVRTAAGGITVWIVGQALVNIAVVLRLAPGLGVPLPFISQGGTSLLSVLLACGALLSLARSLPVADRAAGAAPVSAGERAPVQRVD